VEGGVEGGVVGGTVGGVIGGVIGGTLGGTLGNPLPNPSEPRRITSDVTPPERIASSYVEPEYPMVAKRAKISGEVIFECIIDENGNVKVQKVLKPVPMVVDAAREAVEKWKYKPAIFEGRPQAVLMTVRVKFNLSG
jgi:protein TonB